MTQTEAIVKVLTHIVAQMTAVCVEKGLTTEQSVRLVKEVLAHPTTRTWAALQVMSLAA